MREAGLKHHKQVDRIQDKIVHIGAFWRPEGVAGLKLVYGKWARRFYRCTGREILKNVLAKNLIPEWKMEELEKRHAQRELRVEAEAQASKASDGNLVRPPGVLPFPAGSAEGLEGEPETIDGIVEQLYGKESSQ